MRTNKTFSYCFKVAEATFLQQQLWTLHARISLKSHPCFNLHCTRSPIFRCGHSLAMIFRKRPCLVYQKKLNKQVITLTTSHVDAALSLDDDMSKSSESESDLPGSIHVTDDEDSMLTSDDDLGVSCITIYGVTVLTASIPYQMFKFEDKKEEEITAENKYLNK